MKQKALLLTAGALALGILASCGQNNNPTPEESSSSEPSSSQSQSESSSSSSSEKKEVSIGKVSFTYGADYQVDVNANGGTTNFSSYKRDVDVEVSADLDLTAGDLYLNITGSTINHLTQESATLLKEKVYKTDAGYFYLGTGESVGVALADEAAAKAKIAEVIHTVTYTDAGSVELDKTFGYEENNVYQWKNFSLESTCVGPNEDYPTEIPFDLYWDAPTVTDVEGGKKVTHNASYVGYHTDAGISDFGKASKDAANSALIEVTVNNDDLVTAWSETYNNSTLEFNIMTPPPTVIISGTRSFSANYNATFEKEEGEAAVKAAFDATVDSHITGYTWHTMIGSDPTTMVNLADGVSEIDVVDNLYLLINPTVEADYAIDTATCNGEAMSKFGPYYAAPVNAAGAYHINLTSKSTKVALVSIDGDAHLSNVVAKYLVAPAYTTYLDLVDGGFTPSDEKGKETWITAEATVEEGYEIDWENSTVEYKASAEATPESLSFAFFGGWVVKAVKSGSYSIHLVSKATEVIPEVKHTVTANGDSGVASFKIYDMSFGATGSVLTEITDGSFVETEGHFLAVSVTAAEDATISGVYVNGKAAALQTGYYCSKVDGSTNYNIHIESSKATPITVNGDEHVEGYSLVTMNFSTGAPVMVEGIGAAVEPKAGDFLCVKVNVAEGYEIDAVTCNGKATMLQAGYYCASTSGSPESFAFVISTKAVTSSKVTVTADEGVASYKVGVLAAGAYGPTYLDESLTYTPATGDRLAIQVTLAEGVEIDSVKIDGEEATLQYGMYFTTVKVASTHTIVVTTKTEVIESSKITVTADEGVASYRVAYLVSVPGNPTFLTAAEDGSYSYDNPASGNAVAIMVTCAEGKEVDSVVIDGVKCEIQYGMYYTVVKVAKTHTIVVTTK